jgi:hypothetical protein
MNKKYIITAIIILLLALFIYAISTMEGTYVTIPEVTTGELTITVKESEIYTTNFSSEADLESYEMSLITETIEEDISNIINEVLQNQNLQPTPLNAGDEVKVQGGEK